MANAVRVHGLKELTRDFKRISKDLDKKLAGDLLEAVQPVADKSEQLALTEIRNMSGSPEWAVMKTGVSRAKGTVFMVPASRGSKYSRRNLADLLLQRSMDPAVTQEQDRIVDHVGELIDTLADRYGF